IPSSYFALASLSLFVPMVSLLVVPLVFVLHVGDLPDSSLLLVLLVAILYFDFVLPSPLFPFDALLLLLVPHLPYIPHLPQSLFLMGVGFLPLLLLSLLLVFARV